jgi:predicted small lipoprotein YifL
MRRIFAPLGALLAMSLSVTGCARNGPGAPGSDTDPDAAFQARAAEVARTWKASVGPAWRTGYVPLEEPTSTAAEFTDETKLAYTSGWYRLAGTLPPLTTPTGQVRFGDGATLDVPLVGAQDAYAALDQGDPPCGDGGTPVPDKSDPSGSTGHTVPGQCTALTVTGATLGTATVRTSRGETTVPAWTFAVKELAKPVVRVAVAPSAVTAVPAPSAPPGAPAEGLVSAQDLSAVNGAKIGYRLGVGACDTDIRPLVYENEDVVVLGGATKTTDGACIAVLKLHPVEVTLAAPLGARAVLDGPSGRPLTLQR